MNNEQSSLDELDKKLRLIEFDNLSIIKMINLIFSKLLQEPILPSSKHTTEIDIDRKFNILYADSDLLDSRITTCRSAIEILKERSDVENIADEFALIDEINNLVQSVKRFERKLFDFISNIKTELGVDILPFESKKN